MVASSTGNMTRLAPLAAASSIPFSPFFVALMVLAVAVSAMVVVLLAVILVRYREREGAPLPPQAHGNKQLEIAWTVAPVILLLGLFGWMVWEMVRGLTPGRELPEGNDPDIIVVGHQWWWEIRYPKHGDVVTANEVYLPVGQPMLVQLTSADVQHDFWVPQLGQKMDMYPGKTNYTWLRARVAGDYHGACAEFCGAQHAWMRILAIALPQAEFDAWIEAQRASNQPPVGLADRPPDPAGVGRQLFDRYACGSCHAIAGTEHTGQAAPALTNYSARRTISAGVLEHTPENLALYLRNPHAVKPGLLMPNFRLAESEVQALVAYLESLR